MHGRIIDTPIGVTCVAMVVVSDAAWADATVDNIKMTIKSKPTTFQILTFIFVPSVFSLELPLNDLVSLTL